MDVQTTFLNSYLTVAVYLKQPEGFVQPGRAHQVCELLTPFTGFSKVPGMVLPGWQLSSDQGLSKSIADPNVYYQYTPQCTVTLILYVDDLLLTGTNMTMINRLKASYTKNFPWPNLAISSNSWERISHAHHKGCSAWKSLIRPIYPHARRFATGKKRRIHHHAIQCTTAPSGISACTGSQKQDSTLH